MKNLVNRFKGSNKGIKILLIVLAIAVILAVFKNPITLALMYIVDFVGAKTNTNVVNVIDFLNNIYYIDFREIAILKAMDIVDLYGNITNSNVVSAIDYLNNLYYSL